MLCPILNGNKYGSMSKLKICPTAEFNLNTHYKTVTNIAKLFALENNFQSYFREKIIVL